MHGSSLKPSATKQARSLISKARTRAKKNLRTKDKRVSAGPPMAPKRTRPEAAIRRVQPRQKQKPVKKRMSLRGAIDIVSLHAAENKKLEVLQL